MSADPLYARLNLEPALAQRPWHEIVLRLDQELRDMRQTIVASLPEWIDSVKGHEQA